MKYRAPWPKTINVHTFETKFTDEDKSTQFLFDTKYTKSVAEPLVKYYAKELGRLPKALRKDLKQLYFSKGRLDFDNKFKQGSDGFMIFNDYAQSKWLRGK